MTAEKRGLGKGLGALLGKAAESGTNDAPASDLQRIAISRIRANPFQPRREFNADELAELEASLKASGLLQPISVRRRGDAYELIAGERRLRAATNLGWTEISAIVRDFDDRTMLVLALVENLQRANLNTIDEARGYRRLLDEFKLTQQQVAEAVGKDRTTVTNLLRILALPDAIQQMVEQGKLSAGHARALLPLPTGKAALEVAKHALEQGLSVRQLEQHVRSLANPPKSEPSSERGGSHRSSSTASSAPTADPAAKRLENDLRKYLQTDVKLYVTGDSKGRIELSFYSNDDLDRIIDLVMGGARRDF